MRSRLGHAGGDDPFAVARRRGRLRVRLAFPRGHDPRGEEHAGTRLECARVASLRARRRPRRSSARSAACATLVRSSRPLQAGRAARLPHRGRTEGAASWRSRSRLRRGHPPQRPPRPPPQQQPGLRRGSARWPTCRGRAPALVSVSGERGRPRSRRQHEPARGAARAARRALAVPDRVQMAGDVPPQESGLTCSTWYGKHHTEMIWWHAAHFALWNQPELLARNLEWYRAQLPEARALAAQPRPARGALGEDGRARTDARARAATRSSSGTSRTRSTSASLLYRRLADAGDAREVPRPRAGDRRGSGLDGLASTPGAGLYVLGPPLWIAQEIHDPATSQNPSFELALLALGAGVAQNWRERLGLGRDPRWDDVIARLAPLPVRDGKYVALESHPDTWDNVASRHDHPAMLMPLGFLPERLPESKAGRGGTNVDRATMERTLDAVLARVGLGDEDLGLGLSDDRDDGDPARPARGRRRGPAARRPQQSLHGQRPLPAERSDAAASGAGPPRRPRDEIAVYLPANGALLSAVALMVAGWDGCSRAIPASRRTARGRCAQRAGVVCRSARVALGHRISRVSAASLRSPRRELVAVCHRSARTPRGRCAPPHFLLLHCALDRSRCCCAQRSRILRAKGSVVTWQPHSEASDRRSLAKRAEVNALALACPVRSKTRCLYSSHGSRRR